MVSELCLRVAENRYGSTGSPRTVFLIAYFLKQTNISKIRKIL
ncbi:hypothetical protein [Moraxella lacunata]